MARSYEELPDKTKELGLPEISVVDYNTDEYTIINKPEAKQCPYCATKNGFQVNGERHRKLLDVLLPPGVKKTKIVQLEYYPQQFLCVRQVCKKTFFKPVTFVEKNKRYTCRLEIYVFRRCLKESVDRIEASINGALSNTTIQEIFQNVTKRIDREAPNVWKEPSVMSIHFMKIKTQEVLLVNNIDEECVIDYLYDCSLASVKKLAERFRNPKRIKEIWVDLYDPLINAVKEVFPDATLRIGKLQIKRYIERIMLEAAHEPGVMGRRPSDQTLLKDKKDLTNHTREKLEVFLANNDDVRIVYDLKEELRTASASQVLSIIDSLAGRALFDSRAEFGLYVDISSHKDTIMQSYGEVMRNQEGQRVVDNMFSDSQTHIDELLVTTRKCSFEVLRARALYGDVDYTEALEMSYAFPVRNDKPKEDSMLEKYCVGVMYSCCRMEYHDRKRPMAVGFPFQEVVRRLG